MHAAMYNLASQVFTINLVLWMVQGNARSPRERTGSHFPPVGSVLFSAP